MPEELNLGYAILVSLLEHCLEGCDDKENNFSYLHVGLLETFKAVKSKDKEDCKKTSERLITIMKHHKMHEYAIINFEIIISLLLFSLDPELIDQGRLFVMKRKFTEMASIAEDPEKSYQISYTLINIFGLLVQIQLAMGVQVDFKLPLKYESALEDQKLSYIAFFASLESVQDPIIKPCIDKALSYCEELNFPKYHKLRLNLYTQSLLIDMYSPDISQSRVAMEKIGQLVNELKQRNDELTEQRLVILYCTLMTTYEYLNDMPKFLEAADGYLKYGPKYYESADFLCQTFQKVIYTYFTMGNMAKVTQHTESLLAVGRNAGEESKTYADALLVALDMKRAQGDINFFLTNVPKYEKLVKQHYGDKSTQYVEALKLQSSSYLTLHQHAEAYRSLLKAYDITKEIFGTEVNNTATFILLEMATIKLSLKQYEEVYTLLNKAKKIEEQVSSVNSPYYQQILSHEKLVKEQEARDRPKQNARRTFWQKIAPNTSFKISAYVVALTAFSAGVVYLFKKRE
jgi:hypothetical protein